MNWGFFYKHSVRGKHRHYKSIDNSCDKLLFSYHSYSIHIHCVNSVKVKRNKNETAVNFSEFPQGVKKMNDNEMLSMLIDTYANLQRIKEISDSQEEVRLSDAVCQRKVLLY